MRLATIKTVDEGVYLGNVDVADTFSLVPLPEPGCSLVRNYFLVLPWANLHGKGTSKELHAVFEKRLREGDHLHFPYPATDIRMEGESVDEWTYGKLDSKLLNTAHPDMELQLYPTELGLISITKVSSPLTFKGDLDKELQELGMVPSEARRQDKGARKYLNLGEAAVQLNLSTKQIEDIHDEATKCPQTGWCYARTNDPTVNKLVFETVLDMRPIYKVGV